MIQLFTLSLPFVFFNFLAFLSFSFLLQIRSMMLSCLHPLQTNHYLLTSRLPLIWIPQIPFLDYFSSLAKFMFFISYKYKICKLFKYKGYMGILFSIQFGSLRAKRCKFLLNSPRIRRPLETFFIYLHHQATWDVQKYHKWCMRAKEYTS